MPKSPKRKPFWLEGKLYKRSKEKAPYMKEYVRSVRAQLNDPNFDCLSNYMCPPIKEVKRKRPPSPKTLRCEAEKERRCPGEWTEKCYCKTKKSKKKGTSDSSLDSSSDSSSESDSGSSSSSSTSSASSDSD